MNGYPGKQTAADRGRERERERDRSRSRIGAGIENIFLRVDLSLKKDSSLEFLDVKMKLDTDCV